MQNSYQNKFQLTYCDGIESTQGNIIKVAPDFMKILKQNETITIQGKAQDQFIFSVGDKSFKLRGIYLPTTMLVTPALGTADLSDNSNSNPNNKSLAKVVLQTYNYLKIEAHDIQFQKIFAEISVLALGTNILSQKLPLEYILQNEGVTVSQVQSRYRITNTHLEKIAEVAPITFFRANEIEDNVLMIQLSMSFMVNLLRDLMPILTSQQFLGNWFTYYQLSTLTNLIDQRFFEVVARYFSMQTNPPLPLPKIQQKQQLSQQREYKITLDTILRFIIMQIVLGKNKIGQQEYHEICSNLLALYLPIGHESFTESKAKERIAELTGQYYVGVVKENLPFFIYYDPLLMDFSPKARIQQMSSFKKKFSRSEINGFFFKWYSQQEVDDILLKNFRKMGKDYEIKLIIPK